MAASSREPKAKRPPARTQEEQERRMINKAYALAERQFDDGTASAQVITHYLKLGSSRERLEQARLSEEVNLLKIRAEAIAAAERAEELFQEAMDAFKGYRPTELPVDGGSDGKNPNVQ